jgi:hypothetical protein
MIGQRIEFYQRASDPLCVEPCLRLRPVADRGAGQCQAGNAVVQPARQHPPDGAKAGDGNASHIKCPPIPEPVIRAVTGADKRAALGCPMRLGTTLIGLQ